MSIIDHSIVFVKEKLQNAEAGHDWFHIERVYKNALLIASNEDCDLTIVKLGALLHDIADSKFNDGDETVGPKVAREFLITQNASEEVITHVVNIIENISFKGGNFEKKFTSKELEIVQDADRLDALGAIAIARTFNYGGFKNRPLYNPAIAPVLRHDQRRIQKQRVAHTQPFLRKIVAVKRQNEYRNRRSCTASPPATR